MEKIVRGRRPIRGQLTRVVNEVSDLLTNDSPEVRALQVALELLEKSMLDLENWDQKVKDQLVDDNVTEEVEEEEFRNIEKYKRSYLSAKADLEAKLNERGTSRHSNSDASMGEVKKRKFNLPEVKLKTYGGNLKDWLGWWSQFEKIHLDDELHETDKFQYLSQATEHGTEAKDLIDSYPQTEGNYKTAVRALKDRFGRPDLLLQVYVRELLTLVITNVTSKDKLPLSSLYVKLESHLRSLAELQLNKADPAAWLFPLVESSLSSETLRAWQRSTQSKTDGAAMNPPKTRLDLLMDFVKVEVQCEQQISLAQSGFQQASTSTTAKRVRSKTTCSSEKDEIPTAAGLLSMQAAGCGFCGKSHDTEKCIKAQSMTMEQKTNIIKEKRLCFKCLRRGHRKRQCRTAVKCALCGGNHYPILCFQIGKDSGSVMRRKYENPNPPPFKRPRQDFKDEPQTKTNVFQQSSNQCSSTVQLNTLKVRIQDGSGKLQTIRLVGDSGSHRSYVTTKTVQLANCEWIEDEWLQNVLFGGTVTPPKRFPRHSLTLFGMNGAQMTFELLTKDSITGAIREIPNGPWIREFEKKGVTFNDTGDTSSPVEILIGSDYWGAIRTGQMKKLSCGLVAEETLFGWTLSGPYPVEQNETMLVTTMAVTSQKVEDLWRLEALGIRDPVEVITAEEEQREAYQHFVDNVTRDDEGRYIVALPWRSEQMFPPYNRNVAEMRLKSTTYKLRGEKLAKYHDVFVSWEKEDLVVPMKLNDQSGHLIPHRPIFKDSPTTPVRPVFDASCKKGKEPSLNECLYKGPNLIELIPALLLRFGERMVGVSADIRKAFQMIKVREMDQPYQRFLWWEDTSCSKVVVYQHKRVVFGLTCSPFLLGATINHHLDSIEDRIFAEKLKLSFYVDNVVTSVDSMVEYEELKKLSCRIMNEAKMELRQWASTILSCDTVKVIEEKVVPILGLLWDRQEDTLSCVVKKFEFDKVTKRTILSVIAQIFDPMGMLCPALLIPKMLLQEVWVEKCGWDDEVPTDIKGQFLKWASNMPYLGKVRIPRYSQLFRATTKDYHIFVDSSRDGIAAVGFLRTEINGSVKVQFLLAKSRLTPKVKPTIPRSELIACVIGVRISVAIQKALKVESERFTYWSDSATALAWVKRAGDWSVFVRNRVKEILAYSKAEQWHHVPGTKNPADLPSRGCGSHSLLESKWWEGPAWLKGPKSEFPYSIINVNEIDVLSEVKKGTAMAAAEISSEPRFSSYLKNVAVWGWVLRFIAACRGKKRNDKFLSIVELRAAEKVVIKTIQRESFPLDCRDVGGVQVFRGDDGILRVKSRLTYRDDSENFIFPIILPHSHPLVDQIIAGVHHFYGHGGVQFLLSKIREKYWIIKSRRAVRRVIRRCIPCRRHSIKGMEAEAVAALAAKRMESCEPFTTTGVDLAGPLFLKSKQKAWIVLYTCAVYRAVYLDVVTSLSTEAFLGSLERFVSTYGRPNTMYSDNGTNFVGAVNLFKKIDWNTVENECHVKQIQWVFNPPTAAWWGGFWERLVRSVKDLLKRILGRSKLSYDELRTCLAAVTSTINDRPLTVVSEDNMDLQPLTPAMFIRPRISGVMPELEYSEQLKDSYGKIKEHQVRLQNRFRKEYLSLLVTRCGKKQQNSIKVGDIVLVGSDNSKRFEWPLGLVLELLPGKDGVVRVVKVKTATGIFVRHIQRLFPLEVTQVQEAPEIEQRSAVAIKNECHRTRSGRVSNKPIRYGQWLHLVC